MKHVTIAAVCFLVAASCARPGHEPLSRFRDPKGQFEASFPEKWEFLGNYAQEKTVSPVRWVMASGRIRAYDEGHPIGVSFKISRLPTERRDYPGDDRAFQRYREELLRPRLDAIAAAEKAGAAAKISGMASASRTSKMVHQNPTHGVTPAEMTVRSVIVKAPRAVYEVELVAVSDLFPAYEPLFERSLAAFRVLDD